MQTPVLAKFVTREQCIGCGSADLMTMDAGNFREGLVHEMIAGSPHGEDPLPALREAQWTLQKCSRCSQLFHRSVLDPEWMRIAYSHWASAAAMAEFERRAGADAFARKYQAGVGHVRHVVRLEALTRPLRGAEAVRLVDFGCGRGEFVQACLMNGFEAYGVDFSASRMESARVKIVPALDDAPGLFHAATLFEVLEHVERPADILTALSERMVDGGILVVETPDCSGVTRIASRREGLLLDPIQHINGYTPATLTALVESVGFKRIKRPLAAVAAGPSRVARAVAAYVAGRGEDSTQQYFRKVDRPH